MKINNIVVVFDLDDTLYYEIDYLKSAYKEIAGIIVDMDAVDDLYRQMLYQYHSGNDVFDFVLANYDASYSKSESINRYRKHKPNIILSKNRTVVMDFLKNNNTPIGLITDGRSETQRNKIEKLGLDHYILSDDIIISEEFGSTKPCVDNYQHFHLRYPNHSFVYVGDNVLKDFIAPNQLGWKTICLKDQGANIHKQNFEQIKDNLPLYTCDTISEILAILEL